MTERKLEVEGIAEEILRREREKRETLLAEALVGLGIDDRPARTWSSLLSSFSERLMELNLLTEIEGVEAFLTVGGDPLRIEFGRNFLKIEREGESGKTSIVCNRRVNNIQGVSKRDSLILIIDDGSAVGIKKRGEKKVDISRGRSLGEVCLDLEI